MIQCWRVYPSWNTIQRRSSVWTAWTAFVQRCIVHNNGREFILFCGDLFCRSGPARRWRHWLAVFPPAQKTHNIWRDSRYKHRETWHRVLRSVFFCLFVCLFFEKAAQSVGTTPTPPEDINRTFPVPKRMFCIDHLIKYRNNGNS